MRTRVTLALAAAAALVGATMPAVHADTAVPVGTGTVVQGRGYGHGHGMSQYGAKGQAEAGRTYQQILSFYYPGTRLAQLSATLRVWLSKAPANTTVVRAQEGLKVTDLGTRKTYLLARKPPAWRLVTVAGRTRVHYWWGGAWHLCRVAGRVNLVGAGQLSAANGRLSLKIGTAYKVYRGQLRLAGAKTVNVLSLETYLRGVVPSEMPALWSAQAVRAQAVAARTYAAYERAHSAGRGYDLCDTSSCQVYGGVSAEHPAGTAAIQATAGTIVTYGGTPAFTQFSASNGGWSTTGSAPYLVAKADPYDAYPAWSEPLDRAAIEKAYPSIGTLTFIQVTARTGNRAYGAGGWVTSVKLTGSSGDKTVTGDDVRRLLGLKSSYFRLVNP
ncbi:MAG: SpoIID/LytB domain-containing protein [Nocardioidaceae bacterium]|nr:SpoIID/LytB domain-containing protein [Nocardioidaceae bacterium]